MGLQSKLFRGDAALDACLVRDSAHVLQGARGPHVSKIQHALFVLDGASIATDELAKMLYGPATAAAVLAYKQARKIINYSYQTKADNVVGKMTIAALDREMLAAERKPRFCGCPDPVHGGGGAAEVAVVAGAPVSTVQQIRDQPPKMTAILAVMFQLVRVGDKHGPHSFAHFRELPRRANELLAPHGMRVAAIAGFPFSVAQRINSADDTELTALRKGAEAAMPGFDPMLRVLVVPFGTAAAPDMDTNGRSIGEATNVKGFANFIIINANIQRADKGTLLHEMIHCSSTIRMFDHDTPEHGKTATNTSSIYSYGANRTALLPNHAAELRNARFALKTKA